jgi:hypothetical protein
MEADYILKQITIIIHIYDTQYIQYGRVKRIVFQRLKTSFKEINFRGSALFEIILLYTKNQRTVARDPFLKSYFSKT